MKNTNLEILQTENENLKRENQQFVQQLKQLNERLEESDAFKSHFLSNISNEIINPFTSILGISQNILSLGANEISQIHAMTTLIYSEAFDLDFQLRNIFAAAKIESGEITLEVVPTHIEVFMSDILNNLRKKAEKRALVFNSDFHFSEQTFATDPEKLRMIVVNLLMNAITFSEQKNCIQIVATSSENGFSLSINNIGKPIPEKDLKVIFDRFKKLDTSINSVNIGHGLGLSIIKDYLDLMKGTITVESSAEKGTTFTLVLPPLENEHDNLLMDDEMLFNSSNSELF
ncbi:MAG TPA: histidine kinase [Bacteroidales bacterium]|nr:histidine kinase [Bacteroidales bacterium]